MAGEWYQASVLRKAYLWLRYRPLSYVIATWRVWAWVVSGCPNPLGIIKPVTFIWMGEMSMADFRMGRWHTMQEVIDELREQT